MDRVFEGWGKLALKATGALSADAFSFPGAPLAARVLVEIAVFGRLKSRLRWSGWVQRTHFSSFRFAFRKGSRGKAENSSRRERERDLSRERELERSVSQSRVPLYIFCLRNFRGFTTWISSTIYPDERHRQSRHRQEGVQRDSTEILFFVCWCRINI